jgi:hypothetical protein
MGRIDGIMVSGGVAEYVYGREDRDFGDMGRRLGYALRKRAPYVHGRPGPRFELLLEYRGSDVLRAAGVDVRAAPQYEGVENFREELLLVADHPGGMRSVFSHTCTLKEHDWEIGGRFSEATRIFPGLADLAVLPTAAIRTVSESPIEEMHFPLGSIDFGGGSAGVGMAVWRDARTKKLLTVEFSFETRRHRHGELEASPKLRSERFYRLLREETGAWIDLGSTRTSRIYALAGKKAQHAE